MLSNHYCQNVVSLSLSAEADTGSGGDRPARNSLTKRNGKGGQNIPQSSFLFWLLMPKKTHCFDRNKKEKITIINPKKGQHISGQDRQRSKTTD
jgi:hypothetical protein